MLFLLAVIRITGQPKVIDAPVEGVPVQRLSGSSDRVKPRGKNLLPIETVGLIGERVRTPG